MYDLPEVIFNQELIIITVIDSCGAVPAGKDWRQVTVEVLPDNILLEIFDFYRLDAEDRARRRPWKWNRLAHVCQRWRHVIYTSPLRLSLQILCKSGKTIERVPRAWPTLPLVVGFKGSPRSKSLPKNVVIALRHADRVCEIDLGVTTPISQSITDVMKAAFPALEHIRMVSKDTAEPVVIGEFLGGSAPRLKEIHVDGIAIPFLALRQLVLSANNLIRLVLWNIPKSCYFSPDALVTILSSLVHLQELVIRFRPPVSRSVINTEPPPPLERLTCPSVVLLSLYGASEYVEAFVARTHMPALTTLIIKFFNQLIFEIPQLCGFISRVEGFKVFKNMNIRPAEEFVQISFYRKEKRGYDRGKPRCHLSIPCRQLDWQLSFTAQIFNQLPTLLSSQKLLIIRNLYSIPTGREDVDPAQWLELFQPLLSLSELRVNVGELVPDVVHALINEDTATDILPCLTSLHLEGYRKSPSAIDAAKRFVASRKLANRNILLRG